MVMVMMMKVETDGVTVASVTPGRVSLHLSSFVAIRGREDRLRTRLRNTISIASVGCHYEFKCYALMPTQITNGSLLLLLSNITVSGLVLHGGGDTTPLSILGDGNTVSRAMVVVVTPRPPTGDPLTHSSTSSCQRQLGLKNLPFY